MYSIVARSRTALVAPSAKENTSAPSMKENATWKKKSTLTKSGGPRRPTSVWPVQQLRRFSDKLRLVGVIRARPSSERKTIHESPSDASTIKNTSSAPPALPMLSASTSGASMLLDTLGSLLNMHDAAIYSEADDDGTLAAGTSCDLLAGFLSGPEHLAPPPTPRLPSTPRFEDFMQFAVDGALPRHSSARDRMIFTPPPTPRLSSTPRSEADMLLAPPSPRAGNEMFSRVEHPPVAFAGHLALLTPPPTPRLRAKARF